MSRYLECPEKIVELFGSNKIKDITAEIYEDDTCKRNNNRALATFQYTDKGEELMFWAYYSCYCNEKGTPTDVPRPGLEGYKDCRPDASGANLWTNCREKFRIDEWKWSEDWLNKCFPKANVQCRKVDRVAGNFRASANCPEGATLTDTSLQGRNTVCKGKRSSPGT